MRYKALFTTSLLIVSLSGCKVLGLGVETTPKNLDPLPSSSISAAEAQDDIEFDLEGITDPNFDSITDVKPESVEDVLYTVEDGVAYALDPNTLEPYGPPLDPVTHEPIETAPPAVYTPAPTPVPELTPEPTNSPIISAQESLTPDTKLPNTGIFLEDD